ILLIHSGLVVMMLSELVTGIFAVEARMAIPSNQSANYVEQQNAAELAIVDSSGAKTDKVAVIPDSLLRKGGLIQNDLLPFDVEVVRYMTNSDELKAAGSGMDNPATTGLGLQMIAIERPEGNGVETEQRVDIPSAYVTFKKKGSQEALGTYLVSVWLSM